MERQDGVLENLKLSADENLFEVSRGEIKLTDKEMQINFLHVTFTNISFIISFYLNCRENDGYHSVG